MGQEAVSADHPAGLPSKTVGLLFVHGIGQQQPFDHLTSSVSEIAELLKRDSKTICAVVDRTPGWTGAVGAPTAMGEAPVTLTVTTQTGVTRFECHEVYWADLGARAGIFDAIGFWIWGLGQWAAPVYREIDAAQLTKVETNAKGELLNRHASQLARLPRSVAGEPLKELSARVQLALAGLAALLTLVSWSLIKRLANALLQLAPGPSLLVQYVGDVRTYEESAKPGDTALSDPGFPRRVGIRRRMVAQMVAMGDRAAKGDYDRWYVLGHSLGSVVAYNGLTEIGHTLPNYLSEAQWQGLEPRLRRDEGCALRSASEEALMMPARPSWLKHEDVVNRPLLFEKLSGILTYGSPLNKFAGLWPRIVATATDRIIPGTDGEIDPASAFPPGCRWINLLAPQDPVAGTLDSFGAVIKGAPESGKAGQEPNITQFDGYVPKPETYTTPFWQPYLQAHLNYFQNKQFFAKGYAITHREQVARWLIEPRQQIEALPPMGWGRRLGRHLVALFILAVLLGFATVFVTLAGGIGLSLITATEAKPFHWLAALANLAPVLAASAGVVLTAGLLRWFGDSRTNLLTVKALYPSVKDPKSRIENEAQQALHRWQSVAAAVFIAAWFGLGLVMWFCPGLVPGLVGGQLRPLFGAGVGWFDCIWRKFGWVAAIGAAELVLGLLAILAHALVNRRIPPLKVVGEPRPTPAA